jgi:hypothetical protein
LRALPYAPLLEHALLIKTLQSLVRGHRPLALRRILQRNDERPATDS